MYKPLAASPAKAAGKNLLDDVPTVRLLAGAGHDSEDPMRSVRLLSAAAAVGTFLVIVFGKIVRVTGASTSIPDWPLASGRLVPQMTPLVFWEWSHRLLVLIVFITLLTLTVRAFWLPGRLWLYCLTSLLVLMVTALIGGLSILYKLHWVFAALDQAFAMLFFASVVGLAVWSRLVDIDADGRPVGRKGPHLIGPPG
jgi:heme A synthase